MQQGTILLFLDDERSISDVTWIDYEDHDSTAIFRTVEPFVAAAIDCLSTHDHITLSLDHDLQLFYGDIEHTGKTAINMIIDELLDINTDTWLGRIKVIAHTKNNIGKANIEGIWNCFISTR